MSYKEHDHFLCTIYKDHGSFACELDGTWLFYMNAIEHDCCTWSLVVHRLIICNKTLVLYAHLSYLLIRG